jgi:tetratricopeptide (TPR) repeat protein
MSRFYESRVIRNAQDADSWHGLAVVLRRSEHFAEAALAMSRAVEISPTAEYHREFGLMLRLAGYEERGVHHLVESVRGGALSPTTLLMIGRFQHHQGNYSQAVRTLVLALRLTDPVLRGGHAVALTMCLLDARRYADAEIAFRGAARDELFLPRIVGDTAAVSSGKPLLNPMLGLVWPWAVLSHQEHRNCYQASLRVQQALCASNRAARRRKREDAMRLHWEFQQRQFPSKAECSTRPLLVYVLSGALGGVGLGCEFHGLVSRAICL